MTNTDPSTWRTPAGAPAAVRTTTAATWANFPVVIIGQSERSPRYTEVEFTGEPSVEYGTPNDHRAGKRAHVRTDALLAENNAEVDWLRP